MNRRSFLRNAALVGGSVLTAAAMPAMGAGAPEKVLAKMRGVNLGGWLVTEKWIAPSVYEGISAGDEYGLCQELGRVKAATLLKRHRESWITADDLKWIADRGLNAVRIPVGYWIVEDNPPFISGADTLDWAFAETKKNGIGVVLDLHGAPGSQNGWDHSGRAGELKWHTSKENIAHTVRVVEALAARYKGQSNLIGFELLNEPRWDVPIDILKSYYQDAYRAARKSLGAEQTAVIIHDGFRPFEWAHFMQAPDYSNVILDTHLYQCYTDEDRKRDIYAQVGFAGVERKKQLDRMGQQLPCMVGEWSCALDPQSLRGLSGFALDAGNRAFGDVQLISYETTRGWFFWTYKIQSGGGWSFRDCVKRGWMPDRYKEAGP